MAKANKVAAPGDLIVWRDDHSIAGRTYHVGVVLIVDAAGYVTQARLWCTGIGPGNFATYSVPVGCERKVASASALNKPAEYIACRCPVMHTIEAVQEHMTQYRVTK
jgi:hypothetical protein